MGMVFFWGGDLGWVGLGFTVYKFKGWEER